MFDNYLKASQNSLKAIILTILSYYGKRVQVKNSATGRAAPGMVPKVKLSLSSGHGTLTPT